MKEGTKEGMNKGRHRGRIIRKGTGDDGKGGSWIARDEGDMNEGILFCRGGGMG
jgi:hypothetical protein